MDMDRALSLESGLSRSFEDFHAYFPLLKSVFGLMGVDVSNAVTAYDGFKRLPEHVKGIPLRDIFHAQFALRGWILYDGTDSTRTADAQGLVDEGSLDEAEQILVGACLGDNLEKRLREMEKLQAIRPYWPLAQKAFRNHRKGAYGMAVPIALILMDQLAQQAYMDALGSAEDGAKGDVRELAWDAFCRRSYGLKQLRNLLLNSLGPVDRITSRHSVFYVMDVDATEFGAANAWTALFSVGEWARQIETSKIGLRESGPNA